MSRIEVLARRPKRTLSVLALVLLAVGVAAGTGASFTAQSSNPSNAFATGTLTMSNSVTGAVLNLSNLIPGDAGNGTVDIQNTGSVPATFTLSRTNLSDSDGTNPLSAKINVVLTDCGDFSAGTPTCDGGDPVKYTGTLSAMGSAVSLGTFAVNEKHRYQLATTFDASAGDVYQGDTSSATFQWNATQ